MSTKRDYGEMWEEFARQKAESYLVGRFTPNYGVGFVNNVRERAALRALELRPMDAFLDVGCAAGRQVMAAAARCKRAVGIDIAAGFVERAQREARRQGVENAEFRAVAADEVLPFESAEFDKVLCSEVLEHVLAPEVLLGEVERVLKPGGLLVLTVPNLNGDGTWWGRLLRVIRLRQFEPLREFSMVTTEAHGDSHVREFTARTIRALIESGELRVGHMAGAAFIDFPHSRRVLNRLLRAAPAKVAALAIEHALSRPRTLAPWGRHLVVTAQKPTTSR